jgi:hypothetical protein
LQEERVGGRGTVPEMRASKWHFITAAKSSLRAARALFWCCSRPAVNMRWWSRNSAMGLKIAWASTACLVAAVEESRRATCRGPLLRFFPAILFQCIRMHFVVSG